MRGFQRTHILTAALVISFASTASAQATRTFVSGVGDDANPCSRTAPCKTWAGAIAKTAPGGEMDALDPGGFGAVTITKSITLDGGGGQVASVLVAGTNGIVIAAGSNDVVSLRNIRLDGLLGNGTSPGSAGLDGVEILSAASVTFENDDIFGFNVNGIEVSVSAPVSVAIHNCRIFNVTQAGVSVTSTSGAATVEIDGVHIYNVHPGIRGNTNSVIAVTNSDVSFAGVGVKQVAAPSTISITGSQINGNTTGLEGFAGAVMNVSGTMLAGNGTAVAPNGGTISSDGTNVPMSNTASSSFNGSISRF